MMPRTVLLVDGHDASRGVYATILRYGGYTVLEASDGEEALRLAHDARPSAVVTELVLPRLDGCELARTLKGDSSTAAIPVFAVTADSRGESRLSAEGAGCDAVLLKPCDPAQFLRALGDRIA